MIQFYNCKWMQFFVCLHKMRLTCQIEVRVDWNCNLCESSEITFRSKKYLFSYQNENMQSLFCHCRTLKCSLIRGCTYSSTQSSLCVYTIQFWLIFPEARIQERCIRSISSLLYCNIYAMSSYIRHVSAVYARADVDDLKSLLYTLYVTGKRTYICRYYVFSAMTMDDKFTFLATALICVLFIIL